MESLVIVMKLPLHLTCIFVRLPRCETFHIAKLCEMFQALKPNQKYSVIYILSCFCETAPKSNPKYIRSIHDLNHLESTVDKLVDNLANLG